MSIESIVASGRRLIGTSLLDRAFIQDPVTVTDTTGGTKSTYVERSKAEACRFVSMRDDDPTATLDSVLGRAQAICEFVVGTNIAEGMRIRNVQDSVVWVAVFVLTPPSALAVVARVGIRPL